MSVAAMSASSMAAIQFGGYVNPYKAAGIVVLLIVWVKLLAWIDKDSQEARLPREVVNSIMMGLLILGYFLFFFLPGFGVAIAVLCVCFAADIGTYLFMRSRTIGLGDLKDQLAGWWAGLTKREKTVKVKVVEGQVLMMDKNGTPQEAPPSDSPDSLRYESAQLFLTKPLRYGAERMDLIAAESPGISYLVDGMKYEGDAMDRNKGGAAVQYLKEISGLDMNERRKPQTGNFKAVIDGKKYAIQITSFGSAQGESVRLVTNPKERQNLKYDQLGLSAEQLEMVKELIADSGGLVLLAAPKAQGLTSLCYAMVRAHDAFLYHVHTIERAPELDLEGVTQNALPANASPADEAKQVSWVVSQEPDVLLVTSVEDPKSAQDLAKFAAGDRRVYVGLRAGNALDALKQWRKLVGSDSAATKNLKAIVAGRLVRRLCSACKVGYTPDPNTLRKLNMNPDAVGKLYQARKEPMRDTKGNPVPCTFCHDLAFHGRFGIFEIMMVDDELRNIIANGGTDNQIKQAQRGKKFRALLEVAMGQVRDGETSVEEVLRVMKTDSEAGAAGGSPPRSGPPRAGSGGGGGRPAPAAPSGGRPASSRGSAPAAPQRRPAQQSRPAGPGA
jgi:type II secretory ATPase GspE/PulE/Tfp pilus assembly ATPase PilB-like protein